MIRDRDYEARPFSGEKPPWPHRFRVGAVVRVRGGGGSYDRGEIVAVAADEKYYRVDFGLGFDSLLREEDLEPFDEEDPLSRPPRSFVPPLLPMFPGALR